MKNKVLDRHLAFSLVVLMVAAGWLFACNRGDTPATETTPERLAATPLPTLAFKQPTTMIQADAEAKATATPPGDVDLGRGERLYTGQKCAGCHGAQGEGVAGKGKALAGLTLSEAEFTDILRTGGKGELGNEHLYGTQAISPSGMTALYAYVKSLPAP